MRNIIITTYIVYKHTSPSGKSYVGYTKKTLQERWLGKISELKHNNTPLANALRKYKPETWKHETLYSTNIKQDALDMEIKLIEEHGDYNVAKGGSGGDTGLNNNPDKIKRQSEALSKHWNSLSSDEKERRVKSSIETRIKNGTLGNCNPKLGLDHGNWTGYWYLYSKPYVTLKDAVKNTGMNESTILDLCIRKNSTIWTRGSRYVSKGKTPLECGHYKQHIKH